MRCLSNGNEWIASHLPEMLRPHPLVAPSRTGLPALQEKSIGRLIASIPWDLSGETPKYGHPDETSLLRKPIVGYGEGASRSDGSSMASRSAAIRRHRADSTALATEDPTPYQQLRSIE